MIPASHAGLSEAEDLTLVRTAEEGGRNLITRDRDFGSLVFVQGIGKGVIYLRILSSSVSAVHAQLERVLTLYTERVLRESFLVAEPARHRRQCALCRLKHSQLLDAAHIIPDAEPNGVPEIRNGISMCKLHHAAFDSFVLGITPDYEVEIWQDVLEEIDGPMLRHRLQEMHGRRLILPRQEAVRPDRKLLDLRYARFRQYS